MSRNLFRLVAWKSTETICGVGCSWRFWDENAASALHLTPAPLTPDVKWFGATWLAFCSDPAAREEHRPVLKSWHDEKRDPASQPAQGRESQHCQDLQAHACGAQGY